MPIFSPLPLLVAQLVQSQAGQGRMQAPRPGALPLGAPCQLCANYLTGSSGGHISMPPPPQLLLGRQGVHGHGTGLSGEGQQGGEP